MSSASMAAFPIRNKIADRARRAAVETALDYMGLQGGALIAGTPVDWVFIGSCTNSRLSDLRAAGGSRARPQGRARRARLGGAGVGDRSSAMPLPKDSTGSLRDAGFEWREPGCSMCLAANGETVAPGQRSVSTSNRNFDRPPGAARAYPSRQPGHGRQRRRSQAPSPTSGIDGAIDARNPSPH